MGFEPVDRRTGAWLDGGPPAIIINDLTVQDPSVLAESLRWTTGRRAEPVAPWEAAGADLSAFVTRTIALGAYVLQSAGGRQDKHDLEQIVAQVGEHTVEASARAAESTKKSLLQVHGAVRQMTEDTKQALADASADGRKAYAEDVSAATSTLRDEIQRLLGGENPELVERLSPLLEQFGGKLDRRIAEQTDSLLARAARQFDPSDPTSPVAKHTRALQDQQEALVRTLKADQLMLVAKVEDLATAVNVANSVKAARESLANVSTLKGATYEQAVGLVMQHVAAGLGDEYTETGKIAGAIPRCLKGDAVLSVDGGSARVVLELTDSRRANWNDYLDEAERNREAGASLGLVREQAQNGGHLIRCFGSRRVVMAFDPEVDSPELLRAVVQMLRLSAVSASARHHSDDVIGAEEKVAEAIEMLAKIDEIVKAATTIRKGADKIEAQCNSLHSALNRVLSEAADALAGLEGEDSRASSFGLGSYAAVASI
ncbi:MAG: hypothetical protein QOJ11_417 [Frankiales bacterium]|jgi:hypothetical protein|nr:hypothetical protein [Frankiales bacterium]